MKYFRWKRRPHVQEQWHQHLFLWTFFISCAVHQLWETCVAMGWVVVALIAALGLWVCVGIMLYALIGAILFQDQKPEDPLD